MRIKYDKNLLKKEGIIGKADYGTNSITVQSGLPKRVKKHVILHEKTHFKHPKSSEKSVIIRAGLRDPIGGIKTVKYHLNHNTKKAKSLRRRKRK